MDSSGNLRMVTPEEMMTMEDLSHPVECKSDLPRSKLYLFRAVDKAGNRSMRKKRARKLHVNWNEYQIYRELK